MSLRSLVPAFALAIAPCVSAAPAAANEPPIVRAGGETLEGQWLAPGEAVFRGIPYAAAPVGDLRWRPPAPHRPRAGRPSASEFAPACVQTERLYDWERDIAKAFGNADKFAPPPLRTSEDCLYLNVFTASLGKRPAPVMVWIHGGSNVNGEGSSPWTDGSALARQGAVVVTINYRLGVFGFLAHPALSAESKQRVSGNYALLDQLEALRWVKANIRAFGGDPDRVTAFGESAGAIDLQALLASPAADGLFDRAITQSGALAFITTRLAAAEAQGAALATAAGAATLDELRQKPAADLLKVVEAQRSAGKLSIGPVVDGWVLPDVPGRVFAAGQQRKVPLLTGSNGREMTTLTGLLPPIERTVPAYRKWLAQTAGPAAGRLEELYPAKSDAEVAAALVDAFSDLVFTCTSRMAARATARAGTPAYLYQFTRVPPGGDSLGAYHAAEITYVFGTRRPWLPQEPVDGRIAAAMQRYWLAFAASGKPSVEGLPEWPAHDADSDRYLDIGPAIEAKAGLRRAECDLMGMLYPALWGGAK
jgi:para-nitrobenzyl esterase